MEEVKIVNIPIGSVKINREKNKQPNRVTNSKKQFTAMEQRILYLLFNQLCAQDENNHNTVFYVHASDISANTTEIRKALNKLGTRKLVDNDFRLHHVYPFSEVDYRPGSGFVKFEINKKVMPYYLDNSKGYTHFNLNDALSLSSVYSQKLYEYLSQWRKKGSKTTSLEKLQVLLSAENKQYKDFKRRCLKQAMMEINDKTDLYFTFTEAKVGKRVVNITFQLSDKSKLAKQQAYQDTSEIYEDVASMSPGHIASAAAALLNDYTLAKWQKDKIMGNKALFAQFAVIDNLIKTGAVTPRDNTRYMAASLFHPKKSA